ncbi:MAG: DUF177 domain-containing protein [Deltaproteobacteria bacterium]|nr:DUF177 domain-containing protein [Deltaproteobacteria bacterium]
MLIQVQMVPEDHPLSISFAIPAVFLNHNLQSAVVDMPLLFEHPIKCDVKLRKVFDDIFVQAKITGSTCPQCDRCLMPFDFDISQETQFTCQPIVGNHEVDEDEDLYYFQGLELDLAPILREIVLLGLPMQYICDQACQGLCSDCGEKLDQVGTCGQCQKNTIFPQKTLRV